MSQLFYDEKLLIAKVVKMTLFRRFLERWQSKFKQKFTLFWSTFLGALTPLIIHTIGLYIWRNNSNTSSLPTLHHEYASTFITQTYHPSKRTSPKNILKKISNPHVPSSIISPRVPSLPNIRYRRLENLEHKHDQFQTQSNVYQVKPIRGTVSSLLADMRRIVKQEEEGAIVV